MGSGFTSGNPTATAVAAGTTSNTVLKTTTGCLGLLLITAAGTGAVTVYDSAATNTGTIIGITPENPEVGSTYAFNTPAVYGLTVAGGSTVPGFTVTYY